MGNKNHQELKGKGILVYEDPPDQIPYPKVPISFNFKPTNDESVSIFLKNKIENPKGFLHPLFPETNIYDYPPQQLLGCSEADEAMGLFSPTNEEIFKYYLKPLIQGHKDDYLSIIYKTNELYGEHVDIERTFERGLNNHRKYVNEHVGDDCVWFFTKLKRLGNSKRFDRKAGVGTWIADGAAKLEYEDKKESWKGKTRSLAFTVNDDGLQDVKVPKRKRSSAPASVDVYNNANWIMQEFSIEKNEKQYSDYMIVKIKRKTYTQSCSQQVQNKIRRRTNPQCSQQVQNKAAIEVKAVRATITPPVAYQHQLPMSGYLDKTAAAPPIQYAQQGVSNGGLYTDSRMIELEESYDNVPQEDFDSLMAELEGSTDKPVAVADFRAIGEDNAAARDHHQEGTTVTNSEAEAGHARQEIPDDEFPSKFRLLHLTST